MARRWAVALRAVSFYEDRQRLRTQFAHYYRPEPSELERIWKSAVIALDANILLNLYRYTASTRDELLSVLGGIKERLWVPHQAVYEYFENRFEVMEHRRRLFDGARLELKKSRSVLEELYTSPVKQGAERQAKVDGAWAELESYIDAGAGEVFPPTADLSGDPILAALTELLDGRVGGPYDKDRKAEVLREAAARYASRTPPGYADANKPGENKFGDVVLWLQLLEHARDRGTPVIFVTDDVKEDWWSRAGGKTIGPNPALVEEMKVFAGQSFWMYRAAAFMQYAGSLSDQTPSGSAIEEIEDLRPLQEGARAGESALPSRVTAYVDERREEILRAKRRREAELAAIDVEYADTTKPGVREELLARRRGIVRAFEVQDRELMRLLELEEAVPAAGGSRELTLSSAFYDAPGVARDPATAVWSVPGYTEYAKASEAQLPRPEVTAAADDQAEAK